MGVVSFATLLSSLQSWLMSKDASVWCTAAFAESGTDSIRLLDDQTFETVSVHKLPQHELACSINSVKFTDDPSEYYVVGTAYVMEEELEPSKVGSCVPCSDLF